MESEPESRELNSRENGWKPRVMGHGGGRGGSSVECEESGVVNSMSGPQTPNSFTYPLIAWPIMLLYCSRDFSSAHSAMATFFILFFEHRTLLLFVIPQLPTSLQEPLGWGWMRRYVYYQPSEKGVIWWDCRPGCTLGEDQYVLKRK